MGQELLAAIWLGCSTRGHEVTVFEKAKKENHWGVCAWGASKDVLSKFSNQADLEFDKYIFQIGKKMKVVNYDNSVEYYILNGLVTFDKHKWENDLLGDIDTKFGVRYTSQTFPLHKYDYVLDCTGVNRELLPKCPHDFLIPSLQKLVENDQASNDEFYIINYKNALGYFWHFPLSKGRAYIGAIDFKRKYYGVREYFQMHPDARVIKDMGRPLRISPPHQMQPLHNRNIIGVGESIGTVFPITGEGIGPSLKCCDIFLDVLSDNNDNNFDVGQYTSKVIAAFEYYNDAFKILKRIIEKPELLLLLEDIDLKNLVRNDPSSASRINEMAKAIELLAK